MSEWIGVVNTTTKKFIKGAADNTMRKRLLFAMLRKRGLVVTGGSGTSFQWQVEFDQPEVQQKGSGLGRTFIGHDAFRQMELDWRGNEATDVMAEKDKLMNSGDEALVKLYSTKMSRLMKATKDYISAALYADGNASGNENQWMGLESFLNFTTPAASDLIATPDDSYAGRNTDLGDQSGSWSSDRGSGNYPNATLANDWPFGTGSTRYDYLSPIGTNWSSSNWGTGSTAWIDNCLRASRQTIDWLSTLRGDDGKPSLCLLNNELLTDFKNALEAKQRVIVPHKESEDLGFPEVIQFDGVGFQSEYNCPANSAYFLNMRGEGEYANMKMRVLGPELFISRGPTYDVKEDGYLYALTCFGNLQFNPRFFAKMKNFA